MAKNKTVENQVSVNDFILALNDENKRSDSLFLVNYLETLTGMVPRMWGSSIIGFGKYHYKYESGHEGDSPLISFSPRATALVVYLSSDFPNREELLSKLGKIKSEKACIYLKRIKDIDLEILKILIENHISHLKQLYTVA